MLFLLASFALHFLLTEYYFVLHPEPPLLNEQKPRLAVSFINHANSSLLKSGENVKNEKIKFNTDKKSINPSALNKKRDVYVEQATVDYIAPNYKKKVQMQYPQRARQLKQQGRVVLLVDISAQGVPLRVEVKESSGYAMLDKAAIIAVRQSLFDVQSAVRALIPFDFQLVG